MSEGTDEELVRQASAGSAPAAEALVRRHLRAAIAVGLALLRQPEEAEDVAQEAMETAFRQLESCRDPSRFGPWLLSIVRNRARNRLEQSRVRLRGAELLAGNAGMLGPEPDAGDRRARLLAALGALTEMQREVILLHDLESWTHAEIGTALGISEVNSRQHLFVARRLLRERLRDDAPEVNRGP
jgi:RNA polymerase sigma-70 factor (ECF subfamily)